MNDTSIVELFFNRDDSALTELEIKYGTEMKTYSRRLLRDSRDAEEVYNDTLVEIWNSIPPDYPNKLRAYIKRILECNAISRLRYLGREKRKLCDEILFSEFEDSDDYLDSAKSERSAEDIVIDSSGGFINEFLAGEKSENRRIFLKRYYFGKSMAEIAKEHKTTEGAVYTRLSRIRSRLYQFLREKGVIA